MRSYLAYEVKKTSKADILKSYDSETAINLLRANIERNIKESAETSSDDNFYEESEPIVFEEIPTKFSVGDVARDLKGHIE